LAALVTLGALASQPAAADILKYVGPAYGGYVGTSGLTYSPPGVTSSPLAGGIMMQNLTAGGSFAAWCVDIFTWLNNSASGTNYTLTPGANFYSGSPDKVLALERLASQHLASLSTVSDSGAFQLAVWEIVYETGASYSLGTGAFQVGSATGGAIATANSWLASLGNSAPTMALSVWASGSSQDLAVFAAPVPEPEIYAMMIAGLGLLGFVARRRKRGVAV
jgi:hypothetical protein